MQAVVLIISRKFQVSQNTVEMFSEVEIEIYKVFKEQSWRRFFVCFSFFSMKQYIRNWFIFKFYAPRYL